MKHNWESIRESIGFYATMAVCLAVIALSGYYFLRDREPVPPETEFSTADTPVAATQAEIPVSEEPEEPPEIAETAAPAPVETIPMPEVEVDPTPVVAEAPRLIVQPLQGDTIMAFSMDELVYNPTMNDWRIHDGIDISAKPGDTVLAASSGTVMSVEDDALMGTTVTIQHAGGYQTTYANLQSIPTVEVGDEVSAGQIIGAVGTTAAAEAAQTPHLHFSVTKDGDAVDPNVFLEQ